MNGVYLNIDCMELMANLKDKEIDLAIVDPVFGSKCKLSGGRSAKNGWSQKIDFDKCNKGWNLLKSDSNYFKELFRVSKNQIIWGGNYFISDLYDSSCWIIWDKGQRDFSLADGEMAWTSFNKALRIFTYSRGAFVNDENRFHPTQKPVKLYEWLLTNYAKPNDLILDTHCGSASSLIACENLGFKYIASELDKDYYSQSLQRLQNHLSQGKLFQRQGANEIIPQKGLFE